MKFMITGAAGFIGRKVANWLSLNGTADDQFYLVDELEKFLLRPKAVSNVRNFVCLSPAEGLSKVAYMDGGVIHLGARSSTRDSDLSALVKSNYLYSRDLIDSAVQHSVRTIVVTSAGVYGNGLCRHNATTFEPLTPYAASKSMVDSYAMSTKSPYVMVARPFNVYGVGEASKAYDSQSFLYRVARAVVHGDSLSFHSPEAARDYVYVGDVAIALRNILHWSRNPPQDGRRVFDIGTCRPATVQEVVDHAQSYAQERGSRTSFTNLNSEKLTSDPTYQRYTKASWDQAYPFDSGAFMDWKKGFEMLVDQIKLGAHE